MKSKLQTSWGFDGVIVSTNNYAAKIILIKEGETTPYGHNRKQDKTLFVLQGIVQLCIEGNEKILREGERYHVRPTIKHSICALQGDATVFEIGTKLEDDFVEN